MTDEAAIRRRLYAAIDADGRSDRQVSIDAGLSSTYVNDQRRRGKGWNFSSLMAVCEALSVSTHYILTGEDRDPVVESILAAASKLGDADRDLLLNFANRLAGSRGEGDAKDGDGDA